MSQLLVDIGNSRLKWALSDNQNLHSSALELSGNNLAAEIIDQWHDLQPDSVVFCSVAAKKITEDISAWIKQQWQCPVHHVSASDVSLGVTNAYAEPSQLGADRWASLIAARKLVNGPVCIVDCGTAITVDGMDEKGRHLGGAILPGNTLQKRVLREETARVDWQQVKSHKKFPIKFLGLPISDTTTAVEYGASYGVAGAIDRLVIEFGRQLGDNMVVLLTGGAAPEIAELLNSNFRLESDLVLKGLALLGEYQKREYEKGASQE